MSVIKRLEWRNKRQRVTTTGMEIRAEVYVEPYAAHPLVTSALLGKVVNTGGVFARTAPVADPEYPFCFCVEANCVTAAQEACASGPSMKYDPAAEGFDELRRALGTNFDAPGIRPTTNADEKPFTRDVKFQAPAVIEAVFRPLSTVCNITSDRRSDRQFDYLDPQFSPCFRTITIPKSLYVSSLNFGFKEYAGENDSYVKETWQEFTIRRTMCPRVPYKTIAALSNTLNGTDWEPLNFTLPHLIDGVFPARTLRYDGPQVIRRVVPNAFDSMGRPFISGTTGYVQTDPMEWYDITHKFSWRTIWAQLMELSPAGGLIRDPQWIDWNACFAGPIVGAFPGYYTGWCEAGFLPNDLMIMGRHKYTDAEDAANSAAVANAGHPGDLAWTGFGNGPFDLLFELDSD